MTTPPVEIPELPSLLLSPSESRRIPTPGSRNNTSNRPRSVSFRQDADTPPQAPESGTKVSRKFAEDTEELLAEYFGRSGSRLGRLSGGGAVSQLDTPTRKKETAAQKQIRRHKAALKLMSPDPKQKSSKKTPQNVSGIASIADPPPTKNTMYNNSTAETPHSNFDPALDEVDDDIENSDFLSSFHFVSHMLHRTTQVSGDIPTNDETINREREKNANDEQIQVLANNKEMNGVIESLRNLSLQFKDIVRSVSGHRKELALNIKKSNTTYVRLFERMLFVVLKLQRKKERGLEDQMTGLKEQTSSLVLQNDILQAQLIKLGEQNTALVGLNKSLHVEKEAVVSQLSELERYAKLYYELREKEKVNAVKRAQERDELLERLKNEEEAMLKRMHDAEQGWAEERKKIFEEMSRVKKQKVVKVEKPKIMDLKPGKRIKRFKKPEPVKEAVVIEKKVVEMAENSCQTETNCDGLWQKQDGWIVSTSDDVLARALWRRAVRYASCPCCKGAGEFLKMIVEQSKHKQKKKLAIEEGNEGLEKVPSKKKGRRNGIDKDWMLPDELVEFLCNLPKSVQGTTPKPLPWLCKEINKILDEKFEADKQDEAEAQQTQSMNDFLMELFLKRHGLRRLAELNLYNLIICIKEHYKKSSLAHTFARFMNLIDERSENTPNTSSEKSKKKGKKKDEGR